MTECCNCGKILECPDCGTATTSMENVGDVALGSATQPCPSDCSVWVRVADEENKGVQDVQVKVNGSGKPTDKKGFAAFEHLEESDPTAEIELTGEVAGLFLPPDPSSQSGPVKKGQVKFWEFKLEPKMTWLKVEVKDEAVQKKIDSGDSSRQHPEVSVKIKRLDKEEETKDTDETLAEFEMKKKAGTCSLEELSAEGEYLYEVLEVKASQAAATRSGSVHAELSPEARRRRGVHGPGRRHSGVDRRGQVPRSRLEGPGAVQLGRGETEEVLRALCETIGVKVPDLDDDAKKAAP